MQDNNQKFSFALTSKSSTKPKLAKPSNTSTDNNTSGSNEISNPQYVTEFDSSASVQKLGSSTDSKSLKLMIPPQENEFWTYKRMKNSDLPLSALSDGMQGIRFEVESQPCALDPVINMSYGLNLRQPGKEGNQDVSIDMASDEHRSSRESIDSILLRKLKEDLTRLPDNEGFEQFQDVPVEGFGAAYMAGYGWNEGMGIGKNAKGDVKVEVAEYKPRAFRAGLGALSEHQIRNGNGVSLDIGAD